MLIGFKMNAVNMFSQLHGKTYFRLEHYLPVSVMEKVNQTAIKEELSKLHSNYYGASDTEAEFEFLKVSETGVSRIIGSVMATLCVYLVT